MQHNQILAWRHMNLAVHLILTNGGWRAEPLCQENSRTTRP